MLKEGEKAPQFTLLDADENKVLLKDYLGQKVVVYFYPKDSTPGCTIEAIEFSEQLSAFSKKNTVIFGISKDSVASHKKFINKEDLKVTLLSDPEGKVCESYGVWREKKNYGKTYLGIVRSTFLIDEEGKIEKIWDAVRVKGHVNEVKISLV
jgi:peroxiredoxin Q/BCP